MFEIINLSNYQELCDGLHERAEGKIGYPARWLKGEASKIRRHFLKDISEFDTSAVDRIGRTIVDKRATVLSDDEGLCVTLLLVDNTGDCYDLHEAAGTAEIPVLSQEEIYQRAKELRVDEHTCESSERQDPQAEEDLDIRLTRDWEEYLGVSFPESDIHCD
jgi:hypothetical protein